jgi:hypothetical protein
MAAVVFSTDTDDSGLGLDGTVHNNAWKQAMATAINAAIGDWTAVTYAGGNFTSDVGSWTVDSGDVKRNRYQIINKTMIWNLVIATSTTATTPGQLRVAIPTGTFASGFDYVKCFVSENGVNRECVAQVGDSTHMYIIPMSGTFANETNLMSVFVKAIFEMA